MRNEHGEFALEVKTHLDIDSEDLAELTQRLRAKPLALDVDAVGT